MAFADTARLAVQLDLKGNFTGNLRATQKALGDFDRRVSSTGSRAYKAGTQIGTGIKNGAYIAAGALGFLASQVGFGLRALSELETITAQTNAVLKSTKGVSGQTADSVRKLAENMESLNATMDDKVIQSGENLLLTFTNIRKQAFEPAIKAALDMNTALGRGESGLNGTIRILGKALNDPAKGLTALGRLGVVFTETQKKQIAAALKANDTYKAQSIILAELNKRYGGSFLAGGNTTTGKIAKFKDAIEDLQKALATALLPTVGKVADALSKFLRDPAVIRGVEDLGQSIAGLFSEDNLKAGADVLKSVFATAKEAAPIVVQAAKAMAGIVSTAVGVFRSLPPEIQKLAIGAFAINKITGGLVTNIAGGLISSVLKQLVSGIVNVNGAVVNVNGGVGGIAGAAGAAGGGSAVAGAAAAAVPAVILVGGAVVSLHSIADFAEQNNALARKGLTQDEIIAQRFYNSNQADQDRIYKRLGYLPTKANFASGNAKLAGTITNTSASIITSQGTINDHLTDMRNAQRESDAATRDRIESAKIALVSAEHRTRTATQAVRTATTAAGAKAAAASARVKAAVDRKKLSVTFSPTINTNVRVSARETSKTQTTFKKYFTTVS